MVGCLLLFTAAASTCAVAFRVCKSKCPSCCVFFSDFLAFIVMAAELLLGIIILASKSYATDQLRRLNQHLRNEAGCDVECQSDIADALPAMTDCTSTPNLSHRARKPLAVVACCLSD